jgi:hypothetical protein
MRLFIFPLNRPGGMRGTRDRDEAPVPTAPQVSGLLLELRLTDVQVPLTRSCVDDSGIGLPVWQVFHDTG